MSLSLEEAEIVAEETLQNLTSRMFKLRIYAILLILLGGFFNGLNVYLFALPLDDYQVNIALFLPGVVSLLFAFFIILRRRKTERDFINQFDMTELFDISDEQNRFEEYQKILAIRIRESTMSISPLMNRGRDEKGPDWGKTDFKMGFDPERRDAIVESTKYDGLEADLTAGEELRAVADQNYAEMAQKRWEKAESEDVDLIEYGVEKLGDLVRTDYFEANAEDGVFSKTADPEDKDSK